VDISDKVSLAVEMHRQSRAKEMFRAAAAPPPEVAGIIRDNEELDIHGSGLLKAIERRLTRWS
jgi:hypothetical protein